MLRLNAIDYIGGVFRQPSVFIIDSPVSFYLVRRGDYKKQKQMFINVIQKFLVNKLSRVIRLVAIMPDRGEGTSVWHYFRHSPIPRALYGHLMQSDAI